MKGQSAEVPFMEHQAIKRKISISKLKIHVEKNNLPYCGQKKQSTGKINHTFF